MAIRELRMDRETYGVSGRTNVPAGASARPGFLVIGGRQPSGRRKPDWQLFDRAVIVHADPATGVVRNVVQYTSAPEVMPEETGAGTIFKAGTRIGDRLYTCTSTEVLVYALPSFEIVEYFTHPYFNDLHHVALGPCGELVVVSTGLDLVLVFSPGRELIGQYNVADEPTWSRFSAEIDYRKVPTTKPHKAHPNFAFHLEGDLWVTRFYQKDAIRAACPTDRFAIEVGFPHDGVVNFGNVYFTTVNGYVCVFDQHSRKLEQNYDLYRMSSTAKALGWCRGIEPIAPELVVVGFTRLRVTKFRENVWWVKERLGAGKLLSEATRICCYDLRRRELVWETSLEQYGVNAIFAIHRAAD